jgi:hypothetical protein
MERSILFARTSTEEIRAFFQALAGLAARQQVSPISF